MNPALELAAFAGLMAYLADGTIGKSEPVVFVHTGGAPGLFAQAGAVAAALAG